MSKGKVRTSEGVRLKDFDLDDLDDAVLLEATPTLLRLGLDDDETIEFDGSFAYGEGGGLPVGGTITGFRLVDDGETAFSLGGLSISVETLLAAMADDDEDEDAEDAAEAAAESLVEVFDVDLFSEGVVTLSEPGRFEVSYDGGETVASFVGDFAYGEGGGLPVSGTIAGFTLSEDGEVERSLDGLSIDAAALVAAMAFLADDDEDDDDDDDDDGVFSLLDGLLDGDDRLKGGDAADDLFGESGRDRIFGGGDDDSLDGGDGRDTLKGGAGDDSLTGGLGRDVMVGGDGADEFVYETAEDSMKGRNKDKIRDFEFGEDLLNLSAIDADESDDVDDAFFLGGRKLSGEAGEIAIRGAKIMADVDGDGRVDLLIMLRGAKDLDADDFIL